jgi:alpha-tubulin suppressor-like RCC1 family protein
MRGTRIVAVGAFLALGGATACSSIFGEDLDHAVARDPDAGSVDTTPGANDDASAVNAPSNVEGGCTACAVEDPAGREDRKTLATGGSPYASGSFSCGIKTDGTVTCWGSSESGIRAAPTGTFRYVSAGKVHACGVRTDGTIACWGAFQGSVPEGTFQSVSAGYLDYTCAVSTEGSIACWGNNAHGQSTPPAGKFTSVGAGGSHTCAVKEDGTVACWGDDTFGQATPPPGTFRAVSAGISHSCGVMTDDTVVCWGSDGEANTTLGQGRTKPPPGTFRSVSANGALYTCGVRTDGSLACWGTEKDALTEAPAGAFRSVSPAQHHACALKTDGTAVCWGENTAGESNAPAGTFL